MTRVSAALGDALLADGAAADRAGKMGLYGWLVGSWDLEVAEYPEGAPERRRPGEWHFGWALEGRAIQDVWIVPRRGPLREGDAAANGNRFGTTLRVYDPRSDAWHIQWTDPVSQTYLTMIGRREGDDIVQLGDGPNGTLIRWSFATITPDSFHWRGEVSGDKGATWRVNVEFWARRADGK
jgi:hypothetical protein